jgi:serine/threonine protein phosphatase PrpC
MGVVNQKNQNHLKWVMLIKQIRMLMWLSNNFFNLENNWFFGVFDGHGTNGHKISHFVKKMLPKLIMSKFIKHQKQLKSQAHITFASAAILPKGDEIEPENKTPRYDENENEK